MAYLPAEAYNAIGWNGYLRAEARSFDMPRVIFALFALLVALFTGHTSAQVVQLPTFQFFGISTTVSVPDRGSISLGGDASSSMSGFDNGFPGLGQIPIAGRPFGDRAIASRTQTSGLSVSAYIHDFEAMDESLLREGKLLTSLEAGNVAIPSAQHIRPMVRDSAGRTSVAELRRQQTIDRTQTATSARRDFDRARQLLAEGKTGVAKAYLQRAGKTTDPALRAEIAVVLRNLSPPPVSTQPRVLHAAPR